ncbi:hypothetical protein VI06_15280 [Aquitalea magnusonii]|nr:hypothetical protein VI06_15280 [Aquitalea magnusonii]
MGTRNRHGWDSAGLDQLSDKRRFDPQGVQRSNFAALRDVTNCRRASIGKALAGGMPRWADHAQMQVIFFAFGMARAGRGQYTMR